MSSVVALTPQLHVYGTYSEAFKPQTAFLPTLDLTNGHIGGTLEPQFGRGVEYRGAAHDDRARVVRTVAVVHVRGAAVKDAVDAIDRHFEGVGGDLRENRLQPLADGG